MAGHDLLKDQVITEGGPSVVAYGGQGAVAQSEVCWRSGAYGVAASRELLYSLVGRALGRTFRHTEGLNTARRVRGQSTS